VSTRYGEVSDHNYQELPAVQPEQRQPPAQREEAAAASGVDEEVRFPSVVSDFVRSPQRPPY